MAALAVGEARLGMIEGGLAGTGLRDRMAGRAGRGHRTVVVVTSGPVGLSCASHDVAGDAVAGNEVVQVVVLIGPAVRGLRRAADGRRGLLRVVAARAGRRFRHVVEEAARPVRLRRALHRVTALAVAHAGDRMIERWIADRPGRQGFPLDVLEDLMMLYEINDMLNNSPSLATPAAAPTAWGGPARREHD